MSNGPEDSTADGWNVELSAETADRAEELLRDLATDAELEMAVLVENSGGMIAGVATRQDVDVSTVGALVAGAFGAMGALAKELGESQVKESLHHGSGDTVYLRQVGERFVLLGVAPSSVPSGLVREKGAQVADNLTALFDGRLDEAAAVSEEPAAEPVPAEVAEPEVAEPEVAEQAPQASPAAPELTEAAAPAETDAAFHTEISVEDDHAVSMPSLDPALQARMPETEPDAAAAPEPEPQKDQTGENPTYIFEIG